MKKKIIKVIFYISLFSFFLINSKYIFAQNFAEVINEYTGEYTINKDGTVGVVEKLEYDFGSTQKHGIFRDITYIKTNQDNKRYKIVVRDITVTNEYDQPYTFTTLENKNTGKLNIKIGDANVLVTGIKTYVIKYTLAGALSYFPNDHDEFYWNFIGNEWPVTIEKATSIVKLGFDTNEEYLKVICYTGVLGSTQSNCTYNILNKNLIHISALSPITANSGMTITVGFPNNLVATLEPQEIQKSLLDRIKEFIFVFITSVLIPIAALYWFLILPILLFIKRSNYRKFLMNNQRIVAAWFEPPNDDDKKAYTPAETGALIDKKSDHKEVTATIIHLAQRGFLKIKIDDKKKVMFEKHNKSIDSLKNFEITLFDALFKDGDIVNTDSYEKSESFGKSLQKFFEQVEDSLETHKLFEKDLSDEKKKFILLYGLGLFTMNWLILIVNFLTRNNYIKFSLKGAEKYSEAYSLYNFLKSQDAQLDFQAKNQMFFEKLLPYATAFGVEDIWTKKFEDLKFVKNDWYEGDTSNLYTSSILAHSISSSMRSASAYSSSSRSSSGFSSGFSGGFSGGGGGGGGGGSW
ncbi:hypothetical protein A2V49_02020 [candidate division WWE3 bacterium RBG_19FT_COMBO_34_6]|uniref:DUF2207 domain-containing protein n=1 Tax=candidate division WWE3 bacterium RBG_19FT_COMBO_34_6 TaxID=1802612 RepID=A0A1F4UM15_UNCKA|nr:MAG: hypothetical protein A2V49_02020 [candidate division WWE3 bacterium RBG_19FT_COMBO_34_6]